MTFSCHNEIEIAGGTPDDRRASAALVLAADSVDEGSSSLTELPSSIILRFDSVDGLPEEELESLAPQFPALSYTLVYFSQDGEFYGYARAGTKGSASESADFVEDTRDSVAGRYSGDFIAFVKATYALTPSAG
jgi:hypothetical protein